MHQYEEPPADAQDRAALPMVTTAPAIFTASGTETSVMLSVDINDQGEIGTISVLRDAESLGSSIAGAVRQWQFAPGKRAGANCDSTLIIVVIRVAAQCPPTRNLANDRTPSCSKRRGERTPRRNRLV